MAFPTVLQVVQEAMAEVIRENLTSLVGNTDPDARLLLQLLNRQGRDLAKKGEFGWTILQRLHSFTTVNGTADYALPSDFGRIIDRTAWDTTQLAPMTGPLMPATWRAVKSSLLAGSPTMTRRWRLLRESLSDQGLSFTLDPVPDGAYDLVFEYVSNGWCQSADLATLRDTVAADTDLCILNRDLMVMGIKWRWRSAHNHNIVADLAEYNESLDEALAQDKGTSILSIAGATHSDEDQPPMLGWNNIPDSGYG